MQSLTERQIEDFLKNYKSEIFLTADKLLSQEMPEITRELFDGYEKTGKRIDYENVYFGRRKFLSVFGVACAISHKEEYIKKLEQVIYEVCKEECWALPAHVNRKENQDWRYTIDLFAAETAQTLAHLINLFKNELSEDIVLTVKNEVYKRVLNPFMESEIPYAGWENGHSNWNAVCCGNIGSAALYILEDDLKKRKLIKRLIDAVTNYYLQGFGQDGACGEGLGYWAYGFMYYIMFAVQIKEVYSDIDITKEDKTEAIACFQQKCYLSGNRAVSFSDSDCFYKYPMGFTCCLAYIYGSVRFPSPDLAQKTEDDTCFRWIRLYFDWYWTEKYLKAVKCGKISEPQPIGDAGYEVFADAQWAVFKGKNESAVALKGGHNAEPHNHNDVGSFTYLVCGEAFADDLGSGEYTKDYFSDKRYTVFCNRGISHNIPIINGTDQRAGREFCTDNFSASEPGKALIEFQSAYGVKRLKNLTRKVEFEKETGTLSVTDIAEFFAGNAADASEKNNVTENIVTRFPVTADAQSAVIRGIKNNVKINVCGVDGKIECKEVLHMNHEGTEEKVNIIQWKVREDDSNIYKSRMIFEII